MADEAKTRGQLVATGGVAYGVFLALSFGDLASDLVSSAPPMLVALFAFLMVSTGFWLARAWMAFHTVQRHGAAFTPGDKCCSYDAARSAYTESRKATREARKNYKLEDVVTVDGRDVTRRALFAADEFHNGDLAFRLAVLIGGVALLAFLIAVTWSAAVNTW